LHSHIVSHFAALKALEQPVDMWDAWLVTVLLRKADQATCQEQQLWRKDTELPTYKDLEEFLANRCTSFETSEAWSRSAVNDEDEVAQKMTNWKKLRSASNTKRGLITSKHTIGDKCPCYHCHTS